MSSSNELIILFTIDFIMVLMTIIVRHYNDILNFITTICNLFNDGKMQKMEDLEDKTDDEFFDAETGSELPCINKNVPNNILELFQKNNESNNSQVQRLSNLNAQIMFITNRLGNIEDKYKRKIEKLKNRVAILEKEVTTNSAHIIAINYNNKIISASKTSLGMGDRVWI
ncbi:unnamed protein product [Aphis gossypii]|uniref:Uncharacterized protein n=1 Tax=Aphis gossypii TaxID=80765 RepID=A0A9P0NEI5_APHGO|nr:unnamed protein product [Aphis gossypii]